MNNKKLDKSKIINITSGNSTISELEQYRSEIDNRLYYIAQVICSIINAELNWIDYDNLSEQEEINGYFDPVRYKNEIKIVFKYYGGTYKGKVFNLYQYSFPIDFLWSDFEPIVIAQFNKFKTEVNSITFKNNNKISKDNNYKIVQQIKEKLTPEELSYISFKKYKI